MVLLVVGEWVFVLEEASFVFTSKLCPSKFLWMNMPLSLLFMGFSFSKNGNEIRICWWGIVAQGQSLSPTLSLGLSPITEKKIKMVLSCHWGCEYWLGEGENIELSHNHLKSLNNLDMFLTFFLWILCSLHAVILTTSSWGIFAFQPVNLLVLLTLCSIWPVLYLTMKQQTIVF